MKMVGFWLFLLRFNLICRFRCEPIGWFCAGEYENYNERETFAWLQQIVSITRQSKKNLLVYINSKSEIVPNREAIP